MIFMRTSAFSCLLMYCHVEFCSVRRWRLDVVGDQHVDRPTGTWRVRHRLEALLRIVVVAVVVTRIVEMEVWLESRLRERYEGRQRPRGSRAARLPVGHASVGSSGTPGCNGCSWNARLQERKRGRADKRRTGRRSQKLAAARLPATAATSVSATVLYLPQVAVRIQSYAAGIGPTNFATSISG